MSRIVIERWPNGEEFIVAGWDRPCGAAFLDRYDQEGECEETFGALSGDRPTPDAVAAVLRHWGAGDALATRVRDLLVEHSGLEYPASNVVVDLTEGAA